METVYRIDNRKGMTMEFHVDCHPYKIECWECYDFNLSFDGLYYEDLHGSIYQNGYFHPGRSWNMVWEGFPELRVFCQDNKFFSDNDTAKEFYHDVWESVRWEGRGAFDVGELGKDSYDPADELEDWEEEDE